jgi:hypothetical protein
MPTRRSAVLLPDAAPGDAGPWEVHIDMWQPCTLNEMIGRHPMAIHRRKKKDRGVIAAAFLIARVPRATTKRRVTLTIILGPRQREHDDDNVWKSLLDACVFIGALVDDKPKWLERLPVRYERATRKATRITLEDIDP